LAAPPAHRLNDLTGTQLKNVVIDVIVAYTKKSARSYSDIEQDLIALAIEETNESFRASNLGHIKLRLVHAYQTDYTENGSHFDHVWRFADKGDGHMEEVHGLRDKYRADVAILVVEATRLAGCRGVSGCWHQRSQRPTSAAGACSPPPSCCTAPGASRGHDSQWHWRAPLSPTNEGGAARLHFPPCFPSVLRFAMIERRSA
jgi:hypothetical protein